MRKLIKLLLIMALSASGFSKVLYSAEAASRSSVEAKLALENSLEKRVRMVLSEALGTEDIIVIISAELHQEEKKTTLEFLPGVPEKEKVGEMSLGSSLTMVKQISATLILDKNLPEEDIKLAKKLAAGLLGLPAEREDLINIEKMSFRKTKPFTLKDAFIPPNLWNVLWIVIIIVFGVITTIVFLAPISSIARSFVESFSTKFTPGTAVERTPESERGSPAESAAQTKPQQETSHIEGKKPPFWFINEANLSNLVFILKQKTVEDLTIILNYVPGEVSAKIIEYLYPKSLEALANLPKIRLMPEDKVRQLESEIISALDYVVGGEDKTSEIIENLGEAVQETTLTAFSKSDPTLAKRISGAIVRFSDIKNLEAASIQILTRRVPIRTLANALKNSGIAEEFIKKLTGGMQERFLQELDLTKTISHEQARVERKKVTDALKQLIREGLIAANLQAHQPADAIRETPVQNKETDKLISK